MEKHKLILPISILLGCIILGGFYFASQANKQLSIERQQKSTENQQKLNLFNLDSECAKQAIAFFDYWETDAKAKQEAEISNHYSLKLNKCFIKIKQWNTNDNERYYTEYLFDAVEKKQYGTSMINMKNWAKPISCQMLDNFCQTREEYDNFVSGYMNN